MNQEECREVERALDMFLNESLERVLLSNPTNRDGMVKSRLRPMILKGGLVFQAEELVGKQAFHRNMDKDEAVEYVKGLLEGSFRQMEIASANGSALVLVSKKGNCDREGEGRGIRVVENIRDCWGIRVVQDIRRIRVFPGTPFP